MRANPSRSGVVGDAGSPSAEPDAATPARLQILRKCVQLLTGYPDRIVRTRRDASVGAHEHECLCPFGVCGGEQDGHGAAF